MKIALGQINTKIADFPGNCAKIVSQTEKALELGADMIVFPEMSVCGYPPLDLLTYSSFTEENLKALQHLCSALPPEIAVAAGYVDRNPGSTGKSLCNSAAVIFGGEVVFRQSKSLLPTYDVFDEDRYFEPASSREPFEFLGRKIGMVICEDVWVDSAGELTRRYPVDPVDELVKKGSDIIISMSASPFYIGKMEQRIGLMERISRKYSIPSVYVNAVGANDSLIFDGRSMVIGPDGNVLRVCDPFSEELFIHDTDQTVPDEYEVGDEDVYGDLEKALVLGIRDYLSKTGFSRVNIGISGGIDSALVAVLAVKALGPGQVHGYAMPSRYSSAHSLTDARQLAENLGIGFEEIPIEPMFSAAIGSLADSFRGRESDVTEENIQARIRGVLLMAWANKMGSVLLTTGNKSEMAVGYCTLYGDMNGGLAVIGDLFKTEVFELCRYINRESGYDIIPENIITKPPSAELRPDQLDQDSLPPYDILDGILRMHLLECRSPEEITDAGYDPAVVKRVLTLVEINEYKRRQAAIVLKVSTKAFGPGRRIPIARRLYEADRLSGKIQ